MDVVVMVGVVNVVEIVMAEGCCDASKSLLMSTGQKTSSFEVTGPSVCSPSPYWLVIMTESTFALGVANIVIAGEVDVHTEIAYVDV
jgi:hypothetical protein